jgi:hypothetical protein
MQYICTIRFLLYCEYPRAGVRVSIRKNFIYTSMQVEKNPLILTALEKAIAALQKALQQEKMNSPVTPASNALNTLMN